MNTSKLTNPQVILLFMRQNRGILKKNDVYDLIRNAVFKDMKSFSNAMYQLIKNGFVVKNNGSWFISDAGASYIINVVRSYGQPASASSKDDEIAKLKAENEDLKKALLAYELREKKWIEHDFENNSIIQRLKDELAKARQELADCNSAISTSAIFQNAAEVLKASADMLSHFAK